MTASRQEGTPLYGQYVSVELVCELPVLVFLVEEHLLVDQVRV